MSFVCAKGLGFAYSERVSLLNDVEFRLAPGWHGLVGANGAGKTTLGRLMAGELRPSAGRLWLEPSDSRVLICEQAVDHPAGAFAADGESRRWQGLFGLDPAELARWPTLSPGERKRWQLATTLARCPDVLIVDEPTNHLDQAGRSLMLRGLARFQGVGIVVSHDRELLDRLTTSTLRIRGGAVEQYPLAYSAARELWQSQTRSAEAERVQRVAEQGRLERRMANARREQTSAQKQRSARHRMRDRHDHDASSVQAGGRAERGEARIGRQLTVMSGQLDRLRATIPEFVVDKTLGRSVFVDYVPAPKPVLLGLQGETLMAGGKLLVRDARLTLGRHDRVHLRGPNGSGKSTLVSALLSQARGREHILHLPQELGEKSTERLWAALAGLSRPEQGRIMTILAALGVDPERVLASRAWSPGEARKLQMAFGLATYAWALVLDEPTNHLDLPSIERLEQALSAFPGALLLVSHDVRFASACCGTLWEIRDQRLFT